MKTRRFLLAVFLLTVLLIISFGVFLVTRKEPEIKNLQITNLTSTSVTIVWETDVEMVGSIVTLKNGNFPTLLDKITKNYNYTKDTRGDDLNRIYHYVTLNNLEPDTDYEFRVDGVLKVIQPETYIFKTLPIAKESPNNPDPIYGQVLNYEETETNPQDGIVIYSLVNKKTLKPSLKYASLINSESGWSGDLNSIKDATGALIKITPSEYEIHTEALTPVGSGAGIFSLDSYKPLDAIVVNVHYLNPNGIDINQ